MVTHLWVVSWSQPRTSQDHDDMSRLHYDTMGWWDSDLMGCFEPSLKVHGPISWHSSKYFTQQESGTLMAAVSSLKLTAVGTKLDPTGMQNPISQDNMRMKRLTAWLWASIPPRSHGDSGNEKGGWCLSHLTRSYSTLHPPPPPPLASLIHAHLHWVFISWISHQRREINPHTCFKANTNLFQSKKEQKKKTRFVSTFKPVLSLISFQAGLKAALSCSSTIRQDKAFVAVAERDSVDTQFSKSKTQTWPLSCETVNNAMIFFFFLNATVGAWKNVCTEKWQISSTCDNTIVLLCYISDYTL